METHLLVRRHAPMRNQDPLIVETLVEVLTQDGIQLHTNSTPSEIVKNADGSLTVKCDGQSDITVDYVIWATGRVPATDKFGLENADVETNERGYVNSRQISKY
ncbi:putative fAD/NADP-binding domain-containing protein [Haemophilus haemolyticus M21639]|nr:putative fAD/NADP-binding domain-containing protein [Haemophilus haemolyticus M21639]